MYCIIRLIIIPFTDFGILKLKIKKCLEPIVFYAYVFVCNWVVGSTPNMYYKMRY